MGLENDRCLRSGKEGICGRSAWILNKNRPEKTKNAAVYYAMGKTITRVDNKEVLLIERTFYGISYY